MTPNRRSFLSLFLPVFAGMMALVQPLGHAAETTDKPIGAEDIRVLVREFMASRGLAQPQDRDIWPLDDRISLAPCEHKPEILARSARSNSYIIHCNGPTAWDYTIRIENSGFANGPVAQPGPAQIAKAPSVSDRAIQANAPDMKLASVAAEPEKIEKANLPQSYNVVVPRVDLSAGTILTADMLEVRAMPQSAGMTAFKTVKEAVGLRLTANVGPSSILNTRNVAKAPQVLKGENVTIVAGGSGFEIIAPGKAETEGYEGDLITVRNAKTGVKLTGKLGPGAIVLVK
jgi:flagella basal body P-ring formation protein FlgA